MTDKPEQTLNIYALLIGIDGYKPNRLYKNLKGAVRDVNRVASYLLETLKIPAKRVFKLTSANPEVAETIETKNPEPTYENIVVKFNAITEIAQPGEQVYVYYSGHGGRATTIYPELKGADQYDEGIVPMDVGDREGRYLRDVELTTLLKRMTDKGLIVTQIQSKFPQQLPMLLGDGTRAVFGNETLPTHYSVIVSSVDSNQKQVTLNAGLAHGLSSGTRFAIYPLNATDLSNRQQQLVIVELEDVQAAKSVARVLEPQEGGIEVRGTIEPGAPAVMVSAPVDLVRRVRLFDEKEAGDKEYELPLEWVGKQKKALEPVRQALAENGWVVEVQPGDNQEAHYQVAVGRNGEYEISIGTPIKNLGKPLQIGAPEAAGGAVNRLVHLAKYQAVQALDNPASELADYLGFELLDGKKQPFTNPTNLTLKQGTLVYLRIKNTSSQPLNIAVLDIQPTWAISQYPIGGIEDIYFSLEVNQLKDLNLRPKLPEAEGYEQAKETLKVFATRGMANFQWLTLPALDEDFGRKGNLEEKLQKKVEECAARGESPQVSPLNNLLSTIGADIDNPPPPELTRAMIYEPDPNAEWLTKHSIGLGRVVTPPDQKDALLNWRSLSRYLEFVA